MLFAEWATRKRGIKIESVSEDFPDCIAWFRTGGGEQKKRIEFEYKSINFDRHKHSRRGVDCIVCWEHNWPNSPEHIEIIELRALYEVGRNAWIQPVGEEFKDQLTMRKQTFDWSVSRNAKQGDLILFYLTKPDGLIHDIFRVIGPVKSKKAAHRNASGKDFFASVRRV
ncbi:MAG: hypothetical protein CME20_06255, partial [Gemmatimonadetes bacterium]|nr:hypothetical protein [Gemmatimonadota bacterium]